MRSRSFVLEREAPSGSPLEGTTGDDGTRQVTLDRLLAGLDVIGGRGDLAATTVRDVANDSTRAGPGSLFCCVVGQVRDGHDFAAAALEAGASALLTERLLPLDVTQVVVPRVRPAMAVAAARFHGHPSRQLAVVGVTGTNGKTTTTHLIGAALSAGGRPCPVMGTLSGVRTTPESPEFQAHLAGLVSQGVTAAAVEVSSHALAQHRVDAAWFTVSVFTNLSIDHLDYHGSMHAYFEAKRALFEPERTGLAVVNTDDAYGRMLLEGLRIPARPYSLADATDLTVGTAGSTFRWEGHLVRLRLSGTFNVSNALAAATVARELGVQAADVAEGLSSVSSVPGRFERVAKGQPFEVVVDYAHTPAGLENLLGAARTVAGGGRVLVVFGCGGDRDPSKRPIMGGVACRLADVAVLTSDNPRSEDPLAIIEQVRAGARAAPSEREAGARAAPSERGAGRDCLVVEPDRRAAIASTLSEAQAGDVVVVAGKGHETVQVVGDRAIPFDDRLVAAEELERLGW